ncbi:hypothetical protein AB6A40_002802 [Gnathostoma spinigerum]|uniref:Uncharacterized protein n=1 Tax=Gnathostoma spinigerum TaxID=75299 RepID=A0ABD6EGM2_9BILA
MKHSLFRRGGRVGISAIVVICAVGWIIMLLSSITFIGGYGVRMICNPIFDEKLIRSTPGGPLIVRCKNGREAYKAFDLENFVDRECLKNSTVSTTSHYIYRSQHSLPQSSPSMDHGNALADTAKTDATINSNANNCAAIKDKLSNALTHKCHGLASFRKYVETNFCQLFGLPAQGVWASSGLTAVFIIVAFAAIVIITQTLLQTDYDDFDPQSASEDGSEVSVIETRSESTKPRKSAISRKMADNTKQVTEPYEVSLDGNASNNDILQLPRFSDYPPLNIYPASSESRELVPYNGASEFTSKPQLAPNLATYQSVPNGISRMNSVVSASPVIPFIQPSSPYSSVYNYVPPAAGFTPVAMLPTPNILPIGNPPYVAGANSYPISNVVYGSQPVGYQPTGGIYYTPPLNSPLRIGMSQRDEYGYEMNDDKYDPNDTYTKYGQRNSYDSRYDSMRDSPYFSSHFGRSNVRMTRF